MRETEYSAVINCTADEWTKASLVKTKELTLPALSAASVFGMSCFDTVRITVREDGTFAILCPEQIITALCIKADAMFLPYPDFETVYDALCKLLEAERETVRENGFMYAHILIAAGDVQRSPYPIENSTVTVTLMPPLECPDGVSLVCTPPKDNNTVLAETFRKEGYDGILLLDSVYRKYIMCTNIQSVFFRIGDIVVTPKTEDNVFRASIIRLMRDWNIDVCERNISTDELLQAHDVREVFLCDGYSGMTAVTSIKTGKTVLNFEKGKLCKKLSDTLHNIETGATPPPSRWINIV